jgi:hypothetical protein
MNQKQTLTFSVDGEFITNLAREKFYEEDNLKAAIRLLWDCTLCDQMSEAEHIQLVIHILDGKASIVGIYPNDDYGIEYHKKPVIDNSILNHMDEITRRIRHNATNAEDYRDKFLFLCDNISDSDLILINDKYKNTYHAPLFPKSDENAEYLDRIQ